jgi:FkbM family methyltransferase
MEWEEKLDLFQGLCTYIGERAALERLTGELESNPKERIARKLEILNLAELWYVFEDAQLRRFFEYFQVDCVFDVGANEGQYAEKLRNGVGFRGVIISFEPIPELARRLRAKAKKDAKWYVEELALDREEGTGIFNIMASNQFSSLLPPSHDDVDIFARQNQVIERVQVKKSTVALELEKYSSLASFGNPFLKLDTQGNDLSVVEGAGQSLNRFVGLQSELSIRQLYEGAPSYLEVIEHLRRKGFELNALVPNNAGHFPRLVEIDCIMYRRDIVEAA